MAEWKFEERPVTQVEQELTQRDQFNNDDVGLAEALVREVNQNTLDAGKNGGAVKLRFELRRLEPPAASELRGLFASLRPHLAATGVDNAPLDRSEARVLVIEDYNTTGLSGRYDALDEDNFHNFWRRHGRSGKGGSSGGRWGLGKLVFSSSSQIRAYFGLTVRAGENNALLMGQAVLSNHMVAGRRHPAHGFWFRDRAADGLQLPVTDDATVSRLRQLLGFTRTTQPGLSIAIPYVNDGVTEAGIIRAVVSNFYFPILAGRLAVEVGSVVISRDTFHKVATALGSSADVPLAFVEAVSGSLPAAPDTVAIKAIGAEALDPTFFRPDDLEQIKQLFATGRMIHVRVPVRLRPKDGPDVESPIDLFLMPLPEGGRSFALYARGPIMLIGERRYFSGSPAWGAVVATEDRIAGFLGDAENPAHTGLNSKAEKLAAGWRSPAATLAHVRHSLKHLYDVVAERMDKDLPDVLIDFFSLTDTAQPGKGRKKHVKPEVSYNPREKAIIIGQRKGGFTIAAGPGAAGWTYPRMIRVRAAYDIIGGNPFKRHHPFDFDFRKNEIELTPEHAEISPHSGNVLAMKVTAAGFRLEAQGFDERRDIVVDARVQP